jgi:hypothetical protein
VLAIGPVVSIGQAATKEPLWRKAFVQLSVGGYGTKIEGIKTEVGTIRDNATINASP